MECAANTEVAPSTRIRDWAWLSPLLTSPDTSTCITNKYENQSLKLEFLHPLHDTFKKDTGNSPRPHGFVFIYFHWAHLVFGFYVPVKLIQAIANDMSQVIICLKIYEHRCPNQVS